MKTTVSEKGQITIPKRLRDRLGLDPGTVLEFVAEKGALIGRKRSQTDPVTAWRGRGKLPVGKTAHEYLKKIRGR